MILAIISQWALRWVVTFNPNKTKAMLFSFRLSQTQVPQLIFDITPITFVDNHKHLVITLNNKGRWHDHIQTLIKYAFKVINIMRSFKFTLSRASLNLIYLVYVRSILEDNFKNYVLCTNVVIWFNIIYPALYHR